MVSHLNIDSNNHNMVNSSTLVEHAAVNRRVVGSSPTGGANRKVRKFLLADFFVLYYVSDRSPMLLFLYSSNPRRIVRNPY